MKKEGKISEPQTGKANRSEKKLKRKTKTKKAKVTVQVSRSALPPLLVAPYEVWRETISSCSHLDIN